MVDLRLADPSRGTVLSRTRRGLPWAALLALILTTLVMNGCQDGIVYNPQHYPPGPLEPCLEPVRYATDQGPQISYLRPPHGHLHRLWIFFVGNGGLARNWHYVLGDWPADDALLLIDYPGCGACAGTPSPATIRVATQAAIDAAARTLMLPRDELLHDCGVFGHSLGCATALQCADELPECRRIILLAPFTSLRAMARLKIGWPLCYALIHNIDNKKQLKELAKRKPHPVIGIASGDHDEVIPWIMGEQLSKIVPGTRFWLLPNHNHLGALEAISMVLAWVSQNTPDRAR
jgi:hypothetical protein